MTDHPKEPPGAESLHTGDRRETIAHVTADQRKFKKTARNVLRFLGDGSISWPARTFLHEHYSDFLRLKMASGMVRTFLTQFWEGFEKATPNPRVHGTIATGRSFMDISKNCVDQLGMTSRWWPSRAILGLGALCREVWLTDAILFSAERENPRRLCRLPRNA